MNGTEFRKVCIDAFGEFRELIPNPNTRYKKYYINAYGNRQRGSTGNLALTATQIRFKDANTCVIYIDPKIAPYMPYTTEKWISPKWKGKKNPNEGWFDRAANNVTERIARKLKGDKK